MKQMFRETSVWRNRDLRIVASARAVSVLGDELALIALLLRVHDTGGGARGVTLLLIAAALPTVLLAPWAGRLADQFDSRVLTVASGVAQAVVCAALAAAPDGLPTYALVAALQAGNAVANPTWGALVPRVAGAADTGRVIAATQGLTTLAAVAGPALGGLLTGLGGARLPLLIDAATFLALAAAGAAVHARRGGSSTHPTPARALDGLRVVRADAVLWPVFVTLLAYILVGEASNVAEVFLVRDTLGGTAAQYGLVGMAVSTGIFIGSLLSGRSRRLVRAVVLSSAAQAVAIAVGAAAPTILSFAVAWTALGVANGVLNTTMMMLTMTRVPETSRGQVLAALTGIARACTLGALGLGGVALHLLGTRAVLGWSGGLALVASSWLAWRVRFGGDGAAEPGEHARVPGARSEHQTPPQRTPNRTGPPTRTNLAHDDDYQTVASTGGLLAVWPAYLLRRRADRRRLAKIGISTGDDC